MLAAAAPGLAALPAAIPAAPGLAALPAAIPAAAAPAALDAEEKQVIAKFKKVTKLIKNSYFTVSLIVLKTIDWSAVRMTNNIIKRILSFTSTLYFYASFTSVDYIIEETAKIYLVLLKPLLEKTMDRPQDEVYKKIEKFNIIPQTAAKIAGVVPGSDTTDDLLELFEDYGVMHSHGKLYLKPVTFITTKTVPFNSTQIVPPPQMFDLEDGVDVPFNNNIPDRVCFIVRHGALVSAASLPKDRLIKALNPRTPWSLFMVCKRAIQGWNVDDNAVFKDDLYISLSKFGLPQNAYVDINVLKSILDAGHNCIVIEPKMVGGVPYIPPIASASLYNTQGNVSVVSRYHCEVGHVGNIYDAFVPR